VSGGRPRRPVRGTIGLALLVLAASFASPMTLAVFTDADGGQNDFATDTLDPPTTLAATGGLSTALTWTATTDAYAAGYRVLRSTTSGTGYAEIATVTPASATSTADAPSTSGTFYYVLQSYFQSWNSAASNEALAVIVLGSPSTPWSPCAAGTSVAEAAWGDTNGYETNPDDACADGSGFALDASTGTGSRSASCTNTANDAHRFRDFSLAVPALAVAINGIEVRTDMGVNNNGGTSNICLQLSWDGGTSWTTAKSVTISGAAEATYIQGGTADTWGRTWSPADFSNATFRVRVIDATSQNNKDYRLDYLAVRVSYGL
jgi:hypothetical protein